MVDEIAIVPRADRSVVSLLLFLAVDRTRARATKKTMQVSKDKSWG